MAIGDKYLAVVEVTETDHEQYRWEGAGVPLYRDEIKTLVQLTDDDQTGLYPPALQAAREELRRQFAGWEGNGSDVVKMVPIIRAYLDAL